MIRTADEMKCLGKRKSQLPFQRGLIISSKSLLKLFEVLSQRYNIEFIMTSHLNQDCVENLFSRISRLHCIKICYNISRARSKTSDFCIFERTTSPWINALSKGGLVVPSEDFVSKVYHLEKIFQSVHGSEVLSECNVIKKLANLYI